MLSCLNSKSAPKLERKYVERNRRNHLKNLYKQLHSMLPTYNPKEKVPMQDQIADAALKYIESLKENLEKNQKNLEELKRGQSLNGTNELGSTTTELPPEIEFHEMGPNMVMVLITGLDNIAVFNNIIRLCHEEGVEVVYTSFSLNGNSTLQICHETEINTSSRMEFRATTLCDKIKELIYGPSYENNHEESQLNYLWDYQIEYDALELLPTPSQNPNMPSNYMQNVDEMMILLGLSEF